MMLFPGFFNDVKATIDGQLLAVAEDKIFFFQLDDIGDYQHYVDAVPGRLLFNPTHPVQEKYLKNNFGVEADLVYYFQGETYFLKNHKIYRLVRDMENEYLETFAINQLGFEIKRFQVVSYIHPHSSLYFIVRPSPKYHTGLYGITISDACPHFIKSSEIK